HLHILNEFNKWMFLDTSLEGIGYRYAAFNIADRLVKPCLCRCFKVFHVCHNLLIRPDAFKCMDSSRFVDNCPCFSLLLEINGDFSVCFSVMAGLDNENIIDDSA